MILSRPGLQQTLGANKHVRAFVPSTLYTVKTWYKGRVFRELVDSIVAFISPEQRSGHYQHGHHQHHPRTILHIPLIRLCAPTPTIPKPPLPPTQPHPCSPVMPRPSSPDSRLTTAAYQSSPSVATSTSTPVSSSPN